MKRKVALYKPQHTKIAKYIDFYYEYDLVDEEYFAFPSSKNVVFIMNNAEIIHKEHMQFMNEKPNTEKQFYALNKFSKPLYLKTHGTIKEFVIIFNAYGLAQFTNAQVNNIPFFVVEEFQEFIALHPLFFTYSIDKKIKSIEAFLLPLLKEKKGIDIVTKSVSLMQNENLTLEEIAQQCNCSYKKLYRLFKVHCGTTPMVIKKNIRFRNALNQMKNKEKLNFKLSDVAFDLGFFDQAIFNKAFKQLTGENPKEFFKKVSILAEYEMYFKVVK